MWTLFKWFEYHIELSKFSIYWGLSVYIFDIRVSYEIFLTQCLVCSMYFDKSRAYGIKKYENSLLL